MSSAVFSLSPERRKKTAAVKNHISSLFLPQYYATCEGLKNSAHHR